MLFGLRDVLDILFPLSLEAQSDRGITDGSIAKAKAVQDLNGLLLGKDLREIQRSPLSTHVHLKKYANRLR